MARHNERTDLIDIIEVMEISGEPLKHMRICITGHLAKPRNEIIKLILLSGGQFHKTVSRDTTHLLTNEDWGSVNSVSKKFAKARQYGVKIITEDQFLDLISTEVQA